MACSTFKPGDRVRYVGTRSLWKGGEAVVVRIDCGHTLVVNMTKCLRYHQLESLRGLGFDFCDWERCDGLLDV